MLEVTELLEGHVYRGISKIRRVDGRFVVHFDGAALGCTIETELGNKLIAQAKKQGKIAAKNRRRPHKGSDQWQIVYTFRGCGDWGKYFETKIGQFEAAPTQRVPYVEQPVRNKRKGGLRWRWAS